MSYDILSSVSQNVLKFYQQLTSEERTFLTDIKVDTCKDHIIRDEIKLMNK